MSKVLPAGHCNKTLKLSAGSAQTLLKREIPTDERTGLPPDSDRWSTVLKITRNTATLKLNTVLPRTTSISAHLTNSARTIK